MEPIDVSDMNNDEIDKKRLELSLNDISMMYVSDNYDSDNQIAKEWFRLINTLKSYSWSRLTDSIDSWISIDYLNNILNSFSDNLKRKIKFRFSIIDSENNKPINNGLVYVNWIKLWEFSNWKYEWTIDWLRWIEKFNVVIRSESYGDWFLEINSLNSKGSLLLWNISLKKAKLRNINLWKKQDISFNDTIIWLEECSIVNKNWECYNWSVKLKLTHITWEEANNRSVSLNMQALNDAWEIVNLVSWWMSFIDFISDTWEILKLKDWEKIKISYKVSDQDIKTMSDKKYSSWSTGEWYRWYDKNSWIWRGSEANYFLDIENKLWTAEVSDLY